ncbi:unnamed protein product [Urochloa humidicola]
MNLETKIILDELTKKFDEFESKLGSRFSEAEQKLEIRLKETETSLENRVAEKEEHLETLFTQADDRWEHRFADLHISHEARVAALEHAAINVDDWRPDIEVSLDHIRLEVNKLSKNWERALLDPRVPPVLPTPTKVDPRAVPVFPSATSSPPTAGRPSASTEAIKSNGHQDDLRFRDQGHGSVTTILPDPGKGTNNSTLPPPPTQFHGKRYDSCSPRPQFGDSSGFGKLPKVSFPVFDGDNPRFWVSRCETYFDMYQVDPADWLRVSSMHFAPLVARWFQAIERKHTSLSWPLFCRLLHDRFGKEQHENLLRQLFRIKQTGSVAEYIEEFSSIVDQLDAYDLVSDPLYFTTRFVEGLRDDIRSVVLVQRPSELDSACTIALLQEEVADPPRRKEFKKWDGSSSRPPPRGPLPLLIPPRLDKPVSAPPDDKRAVDSGKTPVDKFANLKAYRRARGLCDRCAEKWHPGHQCAASVQLHAVQELLELFAVDTDEAPSPPVASDASQSSSEQLFLALSNEC